jgi:ribosomal protein L16 Arg81 hydroxylase
VRVIYADRQEVLRAGDVDYMPPGHSGVVEEDYEGIEFSPSMGTNRFSTSSSATL